MKKPFITFLCIFLGLVSLSSRKFTPGHSNRSHKNKRAIRSYRGRILKKPRLHSKTQRRFRTAVPSKARGKKTHLSSRKLPGKTHRPHQAKKPALRKSLPVMGVSGLMGSEANRILAITEEIGRVDVGTRRKLDDKLNEIIVTKSQSISPLARNYVITNNLANKNLAEILVTYIRNPPASDIYQEVTDFIRAVFKEYDLYLHPPNQDLGTKVTNLLYNAGSSVGAAVSTIPEALGVDYSNPNDHIMTGIGAAGLGFGVYDKIARDNHLKSVKKTFMDKSRVMQIQMIGMGDENDSLFMITKMLRAVNKKLSRTKSIIIKEVQRYVDGDVYQ